MHDRAQIEPLDPRSAATLDAPAGARLSGWWIYAGRIGWLLLFILTLVPFVMALPAYVSAVEHPSRDNTALSPQAVAALARAGITLGAYARMWLVIVVFVVLVSAIVALILFWRRSNDWMALLVSLFIVIYPTSIISSIGDSGTTTSAAPGPFAVVIAVAPFMLVFAVTFAAVLLFPSGRFVPRWSWTILVAVSIWRGFIAAQPDLLGGLLFLGYPLFYGAAIACMVYRYRRVSTPLQRLQTRWIVAGFAATLLVNQAFWLPSSFTPLGQTIYPPIVYLAYLLVIALVPVTFFIAIQRYRLYEIDTIINRALVYGSLTAILVATYAAGVIGAQALVGALTRDAGPAQPIVTVATTLLIAALFGPLRRWIQNGIDRRFYRRKYDAAKTLEAFSATLRQEMDLDALRVHLVRAVDETMQPAHVTLWLAPAPAKVNASGTITRVEHRPALDAPSAAPLTPS